MHEGVCVGRKNTLSFFRGKQPKGQKTDWKMQEFIITNNIVNNNNAAQHNNNNPMQLDDWVICKIYQTTHNDRRLMEVISMILLQILK